LLRTEAVFPLSNGFGNAVEEKARRAEQRKMGWGPVITLSVKPDLRKLNADRSEGTILLCAPYMSWRDAEICRGQFASYLDGVESDGKPQCRA